MWRVWWCGMACGVVVVACLYVRFRCYRCFIVCPFFTRAYALLPAASAAILRGAHRAHCVLLPSLPVLPAATYQQTALPYYPLPYLHSSCRCVAPLRLAACAARIPPCRHAAAHTATRAARHSARAYAFCSCATWQHARSVLPAAVRMRIRACLRCAPLLHAAVPLFLAAGAMRTRITCASALPWRGARNSIFCIFLPLTTSTLPAASTHCPLASCHSTFFFLYALL